MVPLRKTAGLVAAFALAASLAPVSAFAAEEDHSFWDDSGPREYPLIIDADVADPEPVVIRVEIPSSSSMVNTRIETSVIDGRFLGFQAGECRIKNLPESSVSISAMVAEVVDGVNGKAKALAHLDVSLASDATVHLQEGAGQSNLILESLTPGSEASIAVQVAARYPDAPIPVGDYATNVTIKVAAA